METANELPTLRGYKPAEPSKSLPYLPLEIILQIVNELDFATLTKFCVASICFNYLCTPILYRKALPVIPYFIPMYTGIPLRKSPFLWCLENDKVATFKSMMEHGLSPITVIRYVYRVNGVMPASVLRRSDFPCRSWYHWNLRPTSLLGCTLKFFENITNMWLTSKSVKIVWPLEILGLLLQHIPQASEKDTDSVQRLLKNIFQLSCKATSTEDTEIVLVEVRNSPFKIFHLEKLIKLLLRIIQTNIKKDHHLGRGLLS